MCVFAVLKNCTECSCIHCYTLCYHVVTCEPVEALVHQPELSIKILASWCVILLILSTLAKLLQTHLQWIKIQTLAFPNRMPFLSPPVDMETDRYCTVNYFWWIITFTSRSHSRLFHESHCRENFTSLLLFFTQNLLCMSCLSSQWINKSAAFWWFFLHNNFWQLCCPHEPNNGFSLFTQRCTGVETYHVVMKSSITINNIIIMLVA